MITPGHAHDVTAVSALMAPITMVALAYQALVINPKLEARNVPELVALAKRKPGALNYSSIGIGSAPHLAIEMFKSYADIDIAHIPYRSAPAALSGLLAGDVDMFMLGVPAATPSINNATLRGLATTAPTRVDGLPDVPTFAEIQQLVDYSIWFAL